MSDVKDVLAPVEPKRTKPSDVAMAEHHAWQLGRQAAEKVSRACTEARHELLQRGFPCGHALCEELDQDAAKWAGMATQMRRSMVKHAELNQIQL
jgi:hypothetical protein